MADRQFVLHRAMARVEEKARVVVVPYRTIPDGVGFPPGLAERVAEYRASGMDPEEGARKLAAEFGDIHPRIFGGPPLKGEHVVEIRVPFAMLDQVEQMLTGAEHTPPEKRLGNVLSVCPPQMVFTFAPR